MRGQTLESERDAAAPVRLIALLAILALGGCAASAGADWNNTRTSHVVSQLQVQSSTLDFVDTFFWLGNEEVMFPARPLGVEDRSVPDAIYIWNVKTNEYRKYADLRYRWSFSFDNGNILYSAEPIQVDPRPSTYMFGRMGQERRIELTPSEFRWSPIVAAARTPHVDPRYEPGDGTMSLVYHLRPEHGFLMVHTLETRDWISRGGYQPVRLVRPDGSPPVVLPLLGRELDTSATIWYSEYLGKYVIFQDGVQTPNGNMTSRPLEEAQPVYLLSPDGKLEKLEIPAGPWRAAAIFPTRRGLVWMSKLVLGHAKSAGAWILEDGKPRKLFDFPAEAASVSPDGCTISYSLGNWPREGARNPWMAQALNLCEVLGKR